MDERLNLRIPLPNTKLLAKRVEKLNRRAKKLGLDPLVLLDRGEDVEYVKVDRTDIVIERRYSLFQLVGSRPQLDGWTVLGTIQHDTGSDSGMNILRAAPGQTIPETYRHAPNLCEHCGTKRRRRDTFILQKDGETLQIGRNCLQDFIGNVDPKAITWYYELWTAEVAQDLVSFSPSQGSSDFIALDEYLAAVHCAIRHHGFVSRAASGPALQATSSVAWGILHRERSLIHDEDWQAAAKVIRWAQTELAQTPGLTGYLANLVAATSGGWMRNKNAGIVASIWRAQENQNKRAQGEKDAKKARESAVNAYLGETKEKTEFVAKVVKVTEREGNYGYYYSTILKAEDGRMAVLQGSKDHGFERDAQVSVKATIKKLDTWTSDRYGTTKVTYLTRGRLTSAS